jgi:two-component system nitrate/nitrite response regulator NarL
MRVLRVLIADDHALVRSALTRAFATASGFAVVGEAADGAQVLPLIDRTNPDVVLLDLGMPQLGGLACLERLRAHHPELAAVVVSAEDDPAVVAAAAERGAAGYVHKSISPLDLPAAVRQAVAGTFVTAPAEVFARQETTAEAAGLSRREAAVLAELARGRSNAEIAHALTVSRDTVVFHLGNLYAKLGVTTRTEAARYAYEHHLVGVPAT